MLLVAGKEKKGGKERPRSKKKKKEAKRRNSARSEWKSFFFFAVQGLAVGRGEKGRREGKREGTEGGRGRKRMRVDQARIHIASPRCLLFDNGKERGGGGGEKGVPEEKKRGGEGDGPIRHNRWAFYHLMVLWHLSKTRERERRGGKEKRKRRGSKKEGLIPGAHLSLTSKGDGKEGDKGKASAPEGFSRRNYRAANSSQKKKGKKKGEGKKSECQRGEGKKKGKKDHAVGQGRPNSLWVTVWDATRAGGDEGRTHTVRGERREGREGESGDPGRFGFSSKDFEISFY